MLAIGKKISPHLTNALLLVCILSSVASSSEKTIDQMRGNLTCVTYADDLLWEEVRKNLGPADEAPRPAPGSLFKNVRVYRNQTVIFHVETKETMEAGRPKHVEVVKSIELCKEK